MFFHRAAAEPKTTLLLLLLLLLCKLVSALCLLQQGVLGQAGSCLQALQGAQVGPPGAQRSGACWPPDSLWIDATRTSCNPALN